MSGGSFSYLCYNTDFEEIVCRMSDLKDMRDTLSELGYEDIAKDTQRLIEYIKSSKISIETLAEMLSPVFKAVEWHYSGDSGKEEIEKAVEKYRRKESEE